MNLFSKIFSNNELVQAGVCPNCWGEQEYDDMVREIIVDKQIDVNNFEAKHSFIRDFVVKHVSGIKLQKQTQGQQCPSCMKIF